MPKTTKTEILSVKEIYKQYLLENGKKPVSVYSFAKLNGMTESEFYKEYNSFDAIESEIWKGFFEETYSRIISDEVYQNYSVREKLLSFYYTMIEVLKENRSYILLNSEQKPDWKKPYLKEFSNAFEEYSQELVQEGVSTKEIMNRPFITERYADGLKTQLWFVIGFWVKDQSKGFEQTDVAIEKSVNTAFDFMGKNPLDSLGDLAKFLYQHAKSN